MRKLLAYRFRRTTLQLLVFVSFLAGIGLAWTGIRVAATWPMLCLVLVLPGYRRRTLLVLLVAVMFGLSAGLWRGGCYMSRVAGYQPYFSQQATFIARAKEDGVYGYSKQMTFAARDLRVASGDRLPGSVQVSGFGANAIYQDDVVELSGKLRPAQGSYQARLSYARITVLEHHPSVIATLRRRFVAGVQSVLPEPLAPFMLGILIGQRSTLPDDAKNDLLHVGLTHIIAVSGYNLTILLQASRKLFSKQSKRIATGLSSGLILLFLLIAGTSASIFRAAIVSMLSIITSYYGRTFKPFNLLSLAAVITAYANPAYVWGDLSWYLSFLAFYGVMILSPLIQKRWPGRLHDNMLVAIMLESVCAEIMTLPLVLFVFGQFSKISLLANVLVVSFIPLAMLLGLVAGLAGMCLGSIAGWLSWPAMLLENYMLDTAHLLAKPPGVFVEDIGFPVQAMVISYVAILLLTIVLTHKTKGRKPDTITDRTEGIYKGIFA